VRGGGPEEIRRKENGGDGAGGEAQKEVRVHLILVFLLAFVICGLLALVIHSNVCGFTAIAFLLATSIAARPDRSEQ
jgi:hypothetical protein